MVECSRVFETINLVQELIDSQVLDCRTGTERCRCGGELSKLECYMQRLPEMEDLSYYEMVKNFTYNKREGIWRARGEDAIVQIIPHGWYKCSCISNFPSSATGSCQARCTSRAGIPHVCDGG